MKLELATQNDYDSIIAFYDDVTECTPEMATYARWSKRKHPTVEGIRAYIDEGSMYLYKEDGNIIGAMAVTMYQGEDYHAIDWTEQVVDDKVAVIHFFKLEDAGRMLVRGVKDKGDIKNTNALNEAFELGQHI